MEMSSAEYRKHNQMIPVVAPSFAVTNPAKRVVLHLSFFVLVALLAAFILTWENQRGSSFYFTKLIYLGFSLLIGIGHIFIFPKWVPHLHNRDLKTGGWFTLILALLTVISAFLLFTVRDFAKPLLAIAGGCAFLLPAAIQQLWNFFDFYSSKTYPPWLLPVSMPLQKKATIFLNSLELKLKIKMDYFDIAEATYMVTAPSRSQLGSMFHGFLMEGDAAKTGIQLADEEQRPYAWRFLLLRPFGTVMLDPALTLAGNKIKRKDIILAERIKTDRNLTKPI